MEAPTALNELNRNHLHWKEASGPTTLMNRKQTEKATQLQTQAISKEKEDDSLRDRKSLLQKGELSPDQGLEAGAHWIS